MIRYFFVKGDAYTPAKFWDFYEYSNKVEILQTLRRIKNGTSSGYILKISNEEVEKHTLCTMNKIKEI